MIEVWNKPNGRLHLWFDSGDPWKGTIWFTAHSRRYTSHKTRHVCRRELLAPSTEVAPLSSCQAQPWPPTLKPFQPTHWSYFLENCDEGPLPRTSAAAGFQPTSSSLTAEWLLHSVPGTRWGKEKDLSGLSVIHSREALSFLWQYFPYPLPPGSGQVTKVTESLLGLGTVFNKSLSTPLRAFHYSWVISWVCELLFWGWGGTLFSWSS